MVVVLAGYKHDIDELMGSNPGLASRFPETIHFKNLGVDESCVLLESSLRTEYGTELAPEAAAELRELVLPIVQVLHVYLAESSVDVLKSSGGSAVQESFDENTNKNGLGGVLVRFRWQVLSSYAQPR